MVNIKFFVLYNILIYNKLVVKNKNKIIIIICILIVPVIELETE